MKESSVGMYYSPGSAKRRSGLRKPDGIYSYGLDKSKQTQKPGARLGTCAGLRALVNQNKRKSPERD
jgi:hypothetical protein